jgi:iron complex transport system substrate-binding protein
MTLHAMRIASLLASGTETVCALGLEDALVGISHECDHPPEVLDRPRLSRPRFDPTGLSSGEIDAAVREALATHGSVYALDEAALRAVAPDLILTQAVCDVCAVPTSMAREASRTLGGRATVLSLDAHDVGGILDTIHQVADAADVPERADDVTAGLRSRMAVVACQVEDRPRPRVLALEWLDPVFVPGHWGPEMIALAGGENLAGETARRSRQLSWDAVRGLDPDVLLVLPCGYDLAQARDEADRHAQRLRAVAPRAVSSGRAWVVNGSAYFNRSGPRVVDGIEILARILHPSVFPRTDLTGRAAVWNS